MRPETLRDLAVTEKDVDWGYCVDGFGHSIVDLIKTGDMADIVKCLEYRPDGGSLQDYMRVYALPKTVLASEDAIRRVAFEVSEDSYADGVRYLEIRFNPLMLDNRFSPRAYIHALADGVNEAMSRFDGLSVVLLLSLVKDHSPVTALRIFEETMAANEDAHVNGLVKGIDSAGIEEGFLPSEFAHIFEEARKRGVGVTCHAGESFIALEDGISMMEEVVIYLHARRIGHGLAAGIDTTTLRGQRDRAGRLYDDDRLEQIKERQKKLRRLLKEKGVLLEVCPSSNVHTGNVHSMEAHPVGIFHAEGVPFAICTDNRRISHTKLSWEVVRMAKVFNWGEEEINGIMTRPFDYTLEKIS
jgi:adenosine deaminase